MLLLLLASLLAPAVALEPQDEAAIMLIEAQRLPPLALAAYLAHEDVDTRVRAAMAIGRLRDGGAIAGLRRVAEDPAVEVRRAVAFALGQTPGAMPLIITRLADETDPETRARLIEAMGRLGDKQVVVMLLHSLNERGRFLRPSPEPAAAAQALGMLAMREIPEARTPLVAEALLDQLHSTDRSTRRAAAFALARQELSSLRSPVRQRLLRAAVEDADPVVRAFLVRASSSLDLDEAETVDLLGEASRDASAAVRVAAARAGGRLKWAGIEPLLTDSDRGVRREAISAWGGLSLTGTTREKAIEVLVQIAQDGGDVAAAEAQATRGDSRLVEATLAIRALAAADALPDPESWLALERPSRIRAAAVQAVHDPARLAELAMKDAEREVRSAAAERLVKQEPDADVLVGLLDAFDPVVAALAAEALTLNPSPQMVDPLVETLKASEDPDLLKAAADTLSARFKGHRNPPMKKDTNLVEALQDLRTHPNSGVRTAASNLLDTIGLKARPSLHQVMSVPLEEVARVQSARVITSRGEVRIDLLPEVAPLTVWNFAWLADQGFYDNLAFHRVVADFVVQHGDPRGDGYGGPAWTIPDELSPLPYEAGVVGMALSGPDTGGSQWFVALSPQPHLNGSYAVFGRVTHGLGLLQTIQPGDKVFRVIIERAAAEPAPGAEDASAPR